MAPPGYSFMMLKSKPDQKMHFFHQSLESTTMYPEIVLWNFLQENSNIYSPTSILIYISRLLPYYHGAPVCVDKN